MIAERYSPGENVLFRAVEQSRVTDADEASAAHVDLEEMRDYLSRAPVEFAVLFGSRARESERAASDVDVALRFPPEMSDLERFRARNRIDADLQAFAEDFVDVSDIDSLPTPVAYNAVRDGIALAGDVDAIEEFRERIEREYESASERRERDRRAFIERLASGET